MVTVGIFTWLLPSPIWGQNSVQNNDLIILVTMVTMVTQIPYLSQAAEERNAQWLIF